MNAFTIEELTRGQEWSRVRYEEFLRRDSMSLGIYMLPRGSTDPQKPHAEDEVYYVVSGRGAISVGQEEQAVAPGSIIYVAKHVEHRFHSISDDLKLLVLFAPSQSSRATQA
jgi:mannose-6-phosphate isomerase-like protein (cupin superfamily)